MAFASFLLSLIVPLYLIIMAAKYQSYQGGVESTPYFAVAFPQGGTFITDLDAGSGSNLTYYSYNSLLVQETNEIMLMTTRVVDQIQVQQVCGTDALNPALSCVANDECIAYYAGTTNVFCNSTTKLCQFDPYKRWCTINQTDNVIPDPVGLSVNVISRLVCHVPDNSGNSFTDATFSNYNSADKNEEFNYTVNVNDVLSLLYKSGDLTTSITKLAKTGADLRIDYNWDCNLDSLKIDGNDRYHCPIETSAHVLSKSSNTSTTRTVWFKDDSGTLTRRYQILYGFRFRFSGTGGCKKTDLNSFLTFIAGGMTLQFFHTIVMGIAAFIFHKRFKVEEPCDQIVPGGEKGEWKLQAWGSDEVVLSGKSKGLRTSKTFEVDEDGSKRGAPVSPRSPSTHPYPTTETVTVQASL